MSTAVVEGTKGGRAAAVEKIANSEPTIDYVSTLDSSWTFVEQAVEADTAEETVAADYSVRLEPQHMFCDRIGTRSLQTCHWTGSIGRTD